MNIPDRWREVIDDGRTIRSVEEDIYSVLPESPQVHLYDRRAAMYDLVVGTRLYNRVMWGASLPDYLTFARQAVDASPTEMMLDAGCGSLLFTAQAYIDCERPIVAFDQSLHMLRRARSRLMTLAGYFPTHIFLLQADISDLPFRPDSFHSVLCMNVLHHVADAGSLIANLKKLLVADGNLYLTSLVKGGRLIGDRYLNALFRWGDFVQPRTNVELETLIAINFRQSVSYRMQGNMAYARASTAAQSRAA